MQYQLKLCAVFNLGISWDIFLKNIVINMFYVCTKILKVSYGGNTLRYLFKILLLCISDNI